MPQMEDESILGAPPQPAPPLAGASPTIHASFNHTDSDVTLASADGTRFHVHLANLAAFSLKFREMIDIGQKDPNVEIIQLSESTETLAILLAMCYPAEDPPVDFSTLEPAVVLGCYEAAVKYQMWVAGLALRSFVEPIVSVDPFQLARLAHKLCESVLLNKAAQATLEVDILANAALYSAKSGPLWSHLLEYHYRHKREVVDALFAEREPQVA
ncbi:hypothetical protein EXIGLDRAFT_758853 [Exidia glandulosa HHB12029]|uniref:BTB domain-containing protein n=1 Tax=Exidia glandulosa HHB12029 TaxID=1314781 RepID=A0A165QEU5_EXIGL|nr:hypothetical protein EXIGLDRAFT_758853 [Exidia glandulosa HHB12029]